jgi:hypothetical protein
MLLELHTILQRLLYERGQISPQEVEIRFEAPTQERVDRLLLPTVSIFLFEVQENVELRQNAYQTVRGNGRAERRPPPRRFDLHFMVSALSSEVEDEHQLLWRVLSTLVRYPQIPEELLPETVRLLEIPLVTQLCQGEESQRLLGIWNALGAQPRPALAYTVTVPVELATVIEAPLVFTRVARYQRFSSNPNTRLSPEEQQAVEIGRKIGGVIRNKSGVALAGVRVSIEGRANESITNAEGRFVLSNVPVGQVNLRILPADGQPRAITIASPTLLSTQVDEADTLPYEIVL